MQNTRTLEIYSLYPQNLGTVINCLILPNNSRIKHMFKEPVTKKFVEYTSEK